MTAQQDAALQSIQQQTTKIGSDIQKDALTEDAVNQPIFPNYDPAEVTKVINETIAADAAAVSYLETFRAQFNADLVSVAALGVPLDPNSLTNEENVYQDDSKALTADIPSLSALNADAGLDQNTLKLLAMQTVVSDLSTAHNDLQDVGPFDSAGGAGGAGTGTGGTTNPIAVPPNNGMAPTALQPADQALVNNLNKIPLLGGELANQYTGILQLGFAGADFKNLYAAYQKGQDTTAFANQAVSDIGGVLGTYLVLAAPHPLPITKVNKFYDNAIRSGTLTVVQSFASAASALVGAAFDTESSIQKGAFNLANPGVIQPTVNATQSAMLDAAPTDSTAFVAGNPSPTKFFLNPDGNLNFSGDFTIQPVDVKSTSNPLISQETDAQGDYTVTSTTLGIDIANVFMSFINNQSTTTPGSQEVVKLVLDLSTYESDPAANPSDPNLPASLSELIAGTLAGFGSDTETYLQRMISNELKPAAAGLNPVLNYVNQNVLSSQGGAGSAVAYLQDISKGMSAAQAYTATTGLPSDPAPTPPRTFTATGPHSVATFQGPEAQYTIKYTGNGTALVTDSMPSRDGDVTSVNNEVLQFSDQPYFIESGDGANIARLYSAGLGRIPDPQGLVNWEGIYSKNISAAVKAQGVYVSLAETSGGFFNNLTIADGIIDSPEFASKYGSLSNQNFVAQLYQNVLGRAPDAIGLSTWLTWMTTGDATGQVYNRGMVLVGFAESPENIAKAGSWMTDMSKSG